MKRPFKAQLALLLVAVALVGCGRTHRAGTSGVGPAYAPVPNPDLPIVGSWSLDMLESVQAIMGHHYDIYEDSVTLTLECHLNGAHSVSVVNAPARVTADSFEILEETWSEDPPPCNARLMAQAMTYKVTGNKLRLSKEGETSEMTRE